MATTKDRKKLVHIHSNVEDKQPLASALEVGELAVNNYAGKEFISLKNSDDKVVRFSSDGTLIDWVEKKEVFPYSGGVTDVNLNVGYSALKLLMNQKAAQLSPHSDSLSNESVTIHMDKYVLSGGNPRFSSLTVNNSSVLNGNTTISGGNGSSATVTTSKVSINGTNKTTIYGALGVEVSGDSVMLSSATKSTVNGNTGVDIIGSGTSGINLKGKTKVDNALTVASGATISGDTEVDGALTVKSGLTVNRGGASINGDVGINGDLNATGSTMRINMEDDIILSSEYSYVKLSDTRANSLRVFGDFTVNRFDQTSTVPNVSVSAYNINMTSNNYTTLEAKNNGFHISGAGVEIAATSSVGYGGINIKSPNNGINMSGNTTIDGTLDVTASGLTKSASWSYGNVSAATSGSYNGSADKSVTIPKSIEHLTNYSGGVVTLNEDVVIKNDLYVSGSIITTGSSAQQNLNLNYGDVRNASNATYNGATEKTVAIPKSIDHLTNYDGTAITMPHSVKVSGAVTADGALVAKNGAAISGDVTVADADDVSIKATNEVSFRTQIVSTNGTINVENGANISGSTKISGNTSILGQLGVTNGLIVTGTSIISGSTYISGNTSINGTLDAKSGLTKSASWSYGSVSAATNDSYNGSADKSVTIPKSIDHLTNYDGTSINLPHNVKVSGTISANSAIYSSDLRVKENVHGITDADIEKVANVHLNEFKFKDDIEHRTMYGVIAQEVNSAGLSSLVHIAEDGKLGVDYISFLILKIAELEKRIKELENSQK